MTGKDPTSPDLKLALRRASDRFRGAVMHPVTQVVDDVVDLDGNGTDTLLLPAAPVHGTPTVTVDGEPVSGFQTSRPNGILRRAGAVWPDGLGNISITYTHGHEEIPGDIVDAVLEQAAILVTSPLPHIQQESAGANSVTFGTASVVGVTQRWSDAVERHRLNRGDRS